MPGQKVARCAALLLVCLSTTQVLAQFDHKLWDRLLNNHVVSTNSGMTTRVDYSGVQADIELLQSYLDSTARVSRAEFDGWDPNEQLAFLINVYNAATVKLVLTEYPDLDSIRDIGFLFTSPFRRDFITLFAEEVSLDDIEHGMIRSWPQFEEPRIHFALNCAAISCPPLRAESYRGDSLDEQLDANTRLFLSNRNINYMSGNRLLISKIFDWYGEDFSKGWSGVDSLEEFLGAYTQELGLSPEVAAQLADKALSIRYTPYDWGLNRAR